MGFCVENLLTSLEFQLILLALALNVFIDAFSPARTKDYELEIKLSWS